MIHLDTNYLIGLLAPGPQASQIDAWIVAGESLSTSAMAWSEFLCGPLSNADAATALIVP